MLENTVNLLLAVLMHVLNTDCSKSHLELGSHYRVRVHGEHHGRRLEAQIWCVFRSPRIYRSLFWDLAWATSGVSDL